MPEVMRSRQWLSEWLSLLLNHLHVQHGGSFLLQPIGLHVTYCVSHAPWARTFSDLIYAMAIPTCRGPNRVTVSVVYTSRGMGHCVKDACCAPLLLGLTSGLSSQACCESQARPAWKFLS